MDGWMDDGASQLGERTYPERIARLAAAIPGSRLVSQIKMETTPPPISAPKRQKSKAMWAPGWMPAVLRTPTVTNSATFHKKATPHC